MAIHLQHERDRLTVPGQRDPLTVKHSLLYACAGNLWRVSECKRACAFAR
jgi:hypothetical protein